MQYFFTVYDMPIGEARKLIPDMNDTLDDYINIQVLSQEDGTLIYAPQQPSLHPRLFNETYRLLSSNPSSRMQDQPFNAVSTPEVLDAPKDATIPVGYTLRSWYPSNLLPSLRRNRAKYGAYTEQQDSEVDMSQSELRSDGSDFFARYGSVVSDTSARYTAPTPTINIPVAPLGEEASRSEASVGRDGQITGENIQTTTV